MIPNNGTHSRREFLSRWANGFGGLAFAALATSCSKPPRERPVGPAKSVIFLYMEGGPSQMDTFDPKPRLDQEHGQPIQIATPPTQFQTSRLVMKSPFTFRRHGRVGAEVSDLFPLTADYVDLMSIVRSMVSEHSEHTAANYFLATGAPVPGRPALGAWLSYGLGSLADDLPAYVVLDSGHMPLGGADCFSNGFLPARHRGVIFRQGRYPVVNIEPREPNHALQAAKLDVIGKLNRHHAGQHFAAPEIEAAIANHELAFRMQRAIPALTDLADETKATRDLYGLDDDKTAVFGRQCVIARRLVERGARFVQLLPPKLEGITSWDQHNDLASHHRANALAVDRPIAGLLHDLRARGLLDQTIVLWGGEFGRTPMAQVTAGEGFGRDHNPYGFTMWLAGGGVRPGHIHGATDEYGYFAVDSPVTIHDLNATILHLMGIDHTKLTFRHAGRDFRLTDVYGEIVTDIVA